MQELLVDNRIVPPETYWDGEYNVDVLKEWHQEKPNIQCTCQKIGEKPHLHVRRTSLGNYTLANNPGHSLLHTPACAFYNEYEKNHQMNEPLPVEEKDGKYYFRIQLFHDREESSSRENKSTATVKKNQGEELTRTYTFANFIFDWYKLALKRIKDERKKTTRSALLYHMWKCLFDHRLFVGNHDFYYYGYIPNRKYRNPKSKKVVVGWILSTRKSVHGEYWTIAGLKNFQITVHVKKNHRPKYPVKNKLAALRVSFEKEANTVSPAMAFSITSRGWWLHSEAEWELLNRLRTKKESSKIERPLAPSERWFGYQPDFVIQRNPPVFIDVLDEPNEKMRNRTHREKQYKTYRNLAEQGIITYVPYKAGDLLKF